MKGRYNSPYIYLFLLALFFLISCAKLEHDISPVHDDSIYIMNKNQNHDMEELQVVQDKNILMQAIELNTNLSNNDNFRWYKTIYTIYFDGNISREEIWIKDNVQKTISLTSITLNNDSLAKVYDVSNKLGIFQNINPFEESTWSIIAYREDGMVIAKYPGHVTNIPELEELEDTLKSSIGKSVSKI